MALVKSILLHELSIFADQKYSQFTGFPESTIDAAEKWSNAINTYAKNVTPISLTFEIARLSFYNIMLTMTEPSLGVVLLPLAFSNYATELALGMAPTYTGISPVNLIDLSSVYNLGFAKKTASECLELTSNIIDSWFKTGNAQLNVLPNTIVPWL